MPKKPIATAIKFNPYDLFAVAKLRKAHSKPKHRPIVSKQPYEPECFHSAYDLSKRPN